MKTKKKLISILLTVSMMLTLFPFAAFAAGDVASVKYGDTTKNFSDLQAAIDEAEKNSGATVTLLQDVTLDGTGKTNTQGLLTIDSGKFSIDGNGKTVSAEKIKVGDKGAGPSMINVENGATVALSNVIIDGGAHDTSNQGAKHGLNVYGAKVNIGNGVTIKNNRWYAVVANGSTVNIDGLTTTGNQWGLNLDTPAGNTKVNIKAATVGEEASVVVENSRNQEVNLDINSGSFKTVVNKANSNATVNILGGKYTGNLDGLLADGFKKNDQGYVCVQPGHTKAVAQVGDNVYASLQTAVDAADNGGEVVIVNNATINEGVKINKDLTLNLNGNTLTNNYTASSGVSIFTMLANQSLTIKDGIYVSTATNGTRGICLQGTKLLVENATVDAEGINICNYAQNGELTVKDSNVSGSYGVGSFANKSKVNLENTNITATTCGIYHNGSYYGLEMTGNNVTVNCSDANSTGAYISGSTTTTTNNSGKNHQVVFTNSTINGGTGIETKFTDLTLTDCKVATTSNVKPSYNQNNNGTTTLGCAVVMTDNTMKADGPAPGGKVIMNGNNGQYKGVVGLASVIDKDTYPNFKEGVYEINSGYFTENPSKYVASGKVAVESNLAGFNWMIADATNPDIKPAVGEPDVAVSDKIADADKDKVSNAAKSVEATGLDDFAASAAQNVTAQQKTDAEVALKEEVSGVNATHIYTQAYLDIDATAYDAQAGTMTLEITPMVQVVASTADKAEDIQLTGNQKNAVVLKGSQKEMAAKGTVVITVTLPEGFVANTDDIYVQHKGYEYTAMVVNSSNTYTATFTNPHGFSPFTFSKTSQAKATIGNQSYTSLQAAVDAAKDGETITLLNTLTDADLQVTVSGDSRTINFKNDTDAEKTLNINGGKLTIANGQTAAYQYTTSSGGGVVTRYDVNLADTDNGTITATHKRASKNSTVTITATPAEGYVVDAVTVTEKDGDKVAVTKKDDNKYTFKMPASDVTVKATFKVAPTEPEQPSDMPFTDVAKDAWYFSAVEYVFNNGLMNGTTATTFAPNVELNRAMMAAVLYNMEGQPACDKSGLFSDVADGKWYTDAVNWAASNNIVSGMPDGTYAPDQALTREQMASILYRYAEYKGIDVSARADLSTFTDGTTVSPWAQDVVQWAVAEKLMSGNGNELQPKGTASRAQVATVLMNYCENVAK